VKIEGKTVKTPLGLIAKPWKDFFRIERKARSEGMKKFPQFSTFVWIWAQQNFFANGKRARSTGANFSIIQSPNGF
jgi:hypothetical protein